MFFNLFSPRKPLRLAQTGPDALPAARRFVVVVHGALPSADYLVLPWLLGRGVEVRVVDAALALPSLEPLREGDYVVLVRYLTTAWRRHLQQQRGRLAGLAFFMDDDLLDAEAHADLPAGYAKKLRKLSLRHGRWIAATCSAVWVSTPALAAKYAGLAPVVLPLTPPPALVEPTPAVRIAYHGTASHAAEIAWLKPVIAAVQAQCGHTHFEIFGDHAVNKAWREVPRTAVLHPMTWPNYLAYTRASRCHIGLAPLLPGTFNAGRGAVKFFDFARMGATGLYSAVPPYAGFVQHGVDGLLLPNEPEAWVQAIVALAADADRLKGLATAAYARALALGEGLGEA